MGAFLIVLPISKKKLSRLSKMPIFNKSQDPSSSSSSSSLPDELIEYLSNLDSNTRIVVLNDDDEDNNEDNNEDKDRTNNDDNNNDDNEDSGDSGDSYDLNEDDVNKVVNEVEFLTLLKLFAEHCVSDNYSEVDKQKIEQFVGVHVEKLEEKKLFKKYPGQKDILFGLLSKYNTSIVKKFIRVFGEDKLEFFTRAVRVFPGEDKTIHCAFDPSCFED